MGGRHNSGKGRRLGRRGTWKIAKVGDLFAVNDGIVPGVQIKTVERFLE